MCFFIPVSDMPNGSASSLMSGAAEPNRSSTARRFGSARATNARSTLGEYGTIEFSIADVSEKGNSASGRAARAHQGADPGFRRRSVHSTSGLPRGAVAAPGGLGRPTGQHAAGGAAVDPCARCGRRAVHLGGRVARASCGGRGFRSMSSPRRDRRPFSLGRFPDDRQGPAPGRRTAARLQAHLDGASMPYSQAGDGLGGRPQRAQVRRHDGHRADPLGRGASARPCGRCRRHGDDPFTAGSSWRAGTCTCSGPTTPEAFTRWAGISVRAGLAAFAALRP